MHRWRAIVLAGVLAIFSVLFGVQLVLADVWYYDYSCNVTVNQATCNYDPDSASYSCGSESVVTKCYTNKDVKCGESATGLTQSMQTGCSGTPNSCSPSYSKQTCTCTAPACPTGTPSPTTAPSPSVTNTPTPPAPCGDSISVDQIQFNPHGGGAQVTGPDDPDVFDVKVSFYATLLGENDPRFEIKIGPDPNNLNSGDGMRFIPAGAQPISAMSSDATANDNLPARWEFGGWQYTGGQFCAKACVQQGNTCLGGDQCSDVVCTSPFCPSASFTFNPQKSAYEPGEQFGLTIKHKGLTYISLVHEDGSQACQITNISCSNPNQAQGCTYQATCTAASTAGQHTIIFKNADPCAEPTVTYQVSEPTPTPTFTPTPTPVPACQSCTSNSQCAANATCQGGLCIQTCTGGDTCSTGIQCKNGVCVLDVCANQNYECVCIGAPAPAALSGSCSSVSGPINLNWSQNSAAAYRVAQPFACARTTRCG